MAKYCESDDCANLIDAGTHCDSCCDKIEVMSTCTRNSGFNDVDHTSCVCADCEHYVQYRSAMHKHCVLVDPNLRVRQFESSSLCDDCHEPLDDNVWICTDGTLRHAVCVDDWEDTLDMYCGICDFRVEAGGVFMNDCQCVMHTFCFSRRVADRKYLSHCPAKKHVKCKECFYCTY